MNKIKTNQGFGSGFQLALPQIFPAHDQAPLHWKPEKRKGASQIHVMETGYKATKHIILFVHLSHTNQ